ncbi:LOW QUALITY PROTEIN: putative uncharacterized protein PQLC2L [Carlito syrichta]|uniref:Uncharacterized protein n=1 Tax=Carlito syrichta TaxID=1868482 RepID=A0A1U7U6X0_CARSF|nr:LOW QUALITY PROTEIN: putative uncharacterized protein PQLC2L [Carlito syrichta]
MECLFVNCHFPVAYKNGKVDAAVSLGFLLFWVGGDLTDFVGCYLTTQLPIQDMPAFVIQRLYHQREGELLLLWSPVPFVYPIFLQIREISISGHCICLCHITINISKRRFVL